MRQVLTLPADLLTYLNKYQKFLADNPPDKNLPNYPVKGKFHEEGRSEYAASVECLESTEADQHDGYPPDSYGYDMNAPTLERTRMEVGHLMSDEEKQWMQKYLEMSEWVDEMIGTWLGFKFCALKMYYPEDGYIAWHTNWNVPGFNCLFTHSDGSGYWRHLDSSQEEPGSVRPTSDKLVHIQDVDGWHCKLGYYGEKQEHNKIMWHAAYGGPRITLGFVVGDPDIWDDIVDEITSAESS